MCDDRLKAVAELPARQLSLAAEQAEINVAKYRAAREDSARDSERMYCILARFNAVCA